MTMTPKGPIIIIIVVIIANRTSSNGNLIIIGPWGVIVIRGGWTPLYSYYITETKDTPERSSTPPSLKVGVGIRAKPNLLLMDLVSL